LTGGRLLETRFHPLDVPSDLKGVDRLNYTSFSTLEDEPERLIGQILPPPSNPEAENFLSKLQDRIVGIVNKSPGQSVTNIAKAVGANIDLEKLAVKNELDVRLRMEGKTRGAKYYPAKR